eukprot:evm.model.scf_34EXC.5 EVM.evm.TU.scf_34EXC.5   scf_34EXC:61565-63324(+)
MSAVRVTNPAHLAALLQLGAVWHASLPLRVTIQRTSPPNAPESVDITFSELKRRCYEALPPYSADGQWAEELYYSTDPAAQLWVGFFHMIEEREERRILGPDYGAEPTLLGKMRAMMRQFLAGRPVWIYLSDLGMADEFGCSGAPVNLLAAATEELRAMANGRDAQLAAGGNGEGGAIFVDLPTGRATVVSTDRGFDRVDFPDDDAEEGDEGVVLAQGVADMQQLVFVARTGATLDGMVPTGSRAPASMRGVYAWEVTVSQLEASASIGESAAVERYMRIARAAIGAAAQRAKSRLAEIGVEERDIVRFTAEHVGVDRAAMFAAVEGDGGAQRGVSHISYSAFEGEGVEGDSVSVAATVEVLRDAGVLGFRDNVLVGGRGGRRLVVGDGERGYVTVEDREGAVVEGRLPGGAVVRSFAMQMLLVCSMGTNIPLEPPDVQ